MEIVKLTQHLKYSPLTHLQTLISCKRSALISLLLLGLFGTLVWLLTQQQQQQQQRLIDHYGNSIIQLSSQQLRLSLSNRNLIGLQSALDDLSQQQRVINAIVYDVNNQILVQAGNTSGQYTQPHKSLTTTIAIDNTVLGSLTLTLDTHTPEQRGLALLTVLLFTATLLGGLHITASYQRRDTVLQTTSPQTTAAPATQQEQAKPRKAAQAAPSYPKTPTTYTILLVLHLQNLDKLYRQLNAETRQQALGQLQSTLKNILTLYSGEQIATAADSLIIKFDSSDRKNAILNALCSAYLLDKTGEQQQWRLSFSSLIFDSTTELDACATLPHSQPLFAKRGLFITKQLIAQQEAASADLGEYITTQALERAKTAEEESAEEAIGFLQVIDFKDNHRHLLNNQLKHLINNHY